MKQLSHGSNVFPALDKPRGVLPEDPRHLHGLWSQLSSADKDALYRVDPFIGNRDGIPHVDRDHYNRKNLAAWYEQALTMPYEPLKRAQAINRCGLIDRTLESPEGSPRRYLTRLDEDFRVAISVGNPDKAAYVVTQAPGTGTNPFGIMNATARSEKIRQAALAIDPNVETAVTTWFGDRPPLPSRAGDTVPAQNDAQPLRSYHEGLRATHEGPAAQHTALGYSSGAVNIGHAAMQPLHADNLIFAGGFGTGVERAADLRLAGVDAEDIGRHVFATVARHDSILLMPKVHGPPPTAAEFGGTVFSSDTARGPWTSFGWNPDIHTSYFDSNSRSMRNIGLIVTGNGHLVT
ncbi:alpha/beta hydrolase [Nocardia sp. NPDC049220]|uniref:alpha/beta hydrolase n=1 Tax=Nocardia sp. NPDC049220 TaxID=3155273 RepID=UPI0033DDF8F7